VCYFTAVMYILLMVDILRAVMILRLWYLLQDEEDIDACIHEINKVVPQSVMSSVASLTDGVDFAAAKPLLSIEHR